MSGWKRLYPKPAGSLPGGIVTQWGVALITVLLLVFTGMWLASGGGETALETAVEDVAAPAPELRWADGRCSGGRGHAGGDTAKRSCAGATGAAAPGGA